VYVIACLFFLRNAQNFWQVLIVKRPLHEVGGGAE